MPSAAAPSCSRPASEKYIFAKSIPTLARELLRRLYDLVLLMEEEKQMFSKDDKNTDCRVMATMLYKILTRKQGPPELSSRMQVILGIRQGVERNLMVRITPQLTSDE